MTARKKWSVPARLTRNLNGGLMLLIHFGAIAYIFVELSSRLWIVEQLSLVAVLAPMTSVFVTMFLKDLASRGRRSRAGDGVVRGEFFAFTTVITCIFGIVAFFLLYHFVSSEDLSTDNLALFLGGLESIVGGFVGILFGELFK